MSRRLVSAAGRPAGDLWSLSPSASADSARHGTNRYDVYERQSLPVTAHSPVQHLL